MRKHSSLARNGLLLIALSSLFLGVWGLQAAPEQAAPIQKLEGLWQADTKEGEAILLRIMASRIEMLLDRQGEQTSLWIGKVQLTPDKPERHMNWTELKAGDRKLPDNRCLYRCRDDVLLVIGGGPDQRPTRFFTGGGGDPQTIVFTRVPEPEKAVSAISTSKPVSM